MITLNKWRSCAASFCGKNAQLRPDGLLRTAENAGDSQLHLQATVAFFDKV